ncbi:MAG: S-layer homology domain-containing protein [Oscillospiraceae bacterium]|nr:S-layer homology domain-containing protein [Oscillospiraceae bacterium]
MKKKILSLALTLAMISSLALCGFAVGFENFTKANTYEDGHFTDVSSNDWYAESVKTAYELGLVKGSTESTFNPKGNITVAETIALAARLHNIYNGGKAELVQGSPWYQVYVDYASENGILREKYSNYSAKISRANFAFILIKALPETALPAINDVPDGTLLDVKDDYKASAIYTLYRAGVLTGNDEFGTFKPDSTITRAEVATIITRMADKTQRKNISLKKKGTISEEIYRGALIYVNDVMMQNYGMAISDYLNENIGYGMTGADMLKQETFGMLTEFEAARLFAIENGIKLTDEEKKEISALSSGGTNDAFFRYLVECQLYYSKSAELFGESGKYAVDTAGIAEFLSGNYVRVKHILIQAQEENYKEKEALAKQVLQKISRGEDFEKLLAEYGEDPGMITNPDGYLIDSNGYTPDGSQMVEEFAVGSNALKVGEVSDIVTTAYGFHIIRRYPIDKAFSDSFIAKNLESFKENALANTLATYIAKVTISNRAELEAIDLNTVFGK